MVEIDPNLAKYTVIFKAKDKRQNQRDDKVEIFRNVAGITDTNNFLDLVREAKKTSHSDYKNNRIPKDRQTIVDINLYDMPEVHCRLTEEQANRLRKHPDVLMVNKEFRIHAAAETVPWGISRVGGGGAVDVTKYHRGYGVKIAVLDTGIDYNHDDLKPNYHGGFSAVDYTTDPMDDNSFVETSGGETGPVYHGTHCSGTAAAALNNTQVVGVAPEAWLYAVKILDKNGGGSSIDGGEGMIWANSNNFDVWSMSFGAGAPDQTQSNAIQSAFNNGVFLAAATDNQGARLTHWPAGYSGVWGVGAVDQANVKASFSNWGPVGYVDFVAPGVGILSDAKGNKTRMLDGTSQATPHIAGIAALAIANYRFTPCDTNIYSPTQTKLINIAGAMISSCDTLGQTSPGVATEMYGFGMPQVGTLLRLLTGS